MSTQQLMRTMRASMAQSIVGQERLLDRLVIGLLCGGHVLVEGLPGLAKTTAVKTLAQAVDAPFKRIQFTPDLMPSDLIGSEILDLQQHCMRFVAGPLFHDIVLADEINRAPAKVQAALLEAMQEKQITVAGDTRKLPDLFMVMATQNPLEQTGTYPLPQAQLDRFLLHVVLDYPKADEELEILKRDRSGALHQPCTQSSQVHAADVIRARGEVKQIHLAPELEQYIVTLVRSTRAPQAIRSEWDQMVICGASPRASLSLSHAASAKAYLEGRDFVTPTDIQQLAPDVLRHRMEMHPSSRFKGLSADALISQLIEAIPAP